MTVIDYLIFALYMAGVLAIGFYHFFRNKDIEDYYVGSRSIKASHVGLSIVATDVGGGFSIGLGGVGFLMGLSGSWLLFTGLVGAWLTAVFIIPKIKSIDAEEKFLTFPDFLRYRYDAKVALVAALISGIGYLGFTGAQMLAGAKLASATILQRNPFGMEPILFALIVIAVVTILYTVVGGLKAVIYTDTIQWIILLTGLLFVTIPVTLFEIGGISYLRQNLPAEYFTLSNISAAQFINWMVTIIPIWLIGMTLYQRMYACKDEKQAKKAWYIAGIFEYPIMAFTGVFLGMCARVVFPEAESEMALPMLIRDILPVGVTGIVIASYFSAIMSTADSCLMASSGNFVNDVIERYFIKNISMKFSIRLSMLATLVIGLLAVVLAAQFKTVLNAILYAYAFMVSGLFIPTLGAYFWKKSSSAGALAGMIGGGVLTLLLMTELISLPESLGAFGLDFSVFGIAFSMVLFVTVSLLIPDKKKVHYESLDVLPMDRDIIENMNGAKIQHGSLNQRIYLMKIGDADIQTLLPNLDNLAEEQEYSKIFAKVPESAFEEFEKRGYRKEALVQGFYNGDENALFLGRYFDLQRKIETDSDKYKQVEKITLAKVAEKKPLEIEDGLNIRVCIPQDAKEMAGLYASVFPSYPFPIYDSKYLRDVMGSHVIFFCVEDQGRIIALSSAEIDKESQNSEMTDFATLPQARGNSYAKFLLDFMEKEMRDRGIKTSYTIARAISPGINITFARTGYKFGGRLINNTNISGRIESMNVWYKSLMRQLPE